MKRIVSLSILCVLLLCGCGRIPYYREESSLVPSTESVSDPVPPFVCGENGFYDTVNDTEYFLEPNIYAKERGELLFSDGEHTVYLVKDLHESYVLCDAQKRIYRNSQKPWLTEPGSTEWTETHPALIYRGTPDD